MTRKQCVVKMRNVILILCFFHQFHLSVLAFQFVLSGTANVVDVHAQVCVLFMILCGFVQTKFLPMIVYPAPGCGLHCFCLRCCQIFLRLLIVPLVRRLFRI